jgi:hypothetical protein
MMRLTRRHLLTASAAAAVMGLPAVTASGQTEAPAFETRAATTTGGEPAVAVSARDPRDIVMAITDRTLVPGAPQVGILVSHDRGRTWRRADRSFAVSSDPFVVADSDGRFYVGGSGNAVGTSGPAAAVNTVQITTSTDGGRSWSEPVEAMGPNADIDPTNSKGPIYRGPSWTSIDRPWGAVDGNTGDVYVTAVDHSDNAGGQTDNTGVPWELNFAVCRTSADGYPVFACGRRYLTVSRDHGRTWRPVQPVDTAAYPADFSGGFSGNPAASHGVLATAYVAASTADPTCHPCVVFGTTTDGGEHWSQRVARGITVYPAGVEDPTASNPSDQTQPYTAADPSRPGRYAVMVLDKMQTRLLVYVSEDTGQHWTGPAVHSVAGRTLLERPWIAYSPSGSLGVMFRADQADGSYDVWGAVSPVGGLGFGSPVRLSKALSPAPNNHSAIDDVSSVAMDDGYLHASWGDVRGGAIQPWYGRLDYRSSAVGVSRPERSQRDRSGPGGCWC